MKKRIIMIGLLLGSVLVGCGNGSSAKEAEENYNYVTIIGEEKETAAESEDKKSFPEDELREKRNVMMLSLEERRELFREYSLKLAGSGTDSDYILCNPDGTVTVFGGDIEKLQEPATWTDIVEVAVSTNYAMGLKSDGTVVVSELFGYDNEVAYEEAETWTDIVHIAANQFFAVGLKKDGTVVWTDHERMEHITQPDQMAEWTDIVQIVSGTGTVFGLKSDGTVVFNHYNEETPDMNGAAFNGLYAPVEAWTDVSYLTFGEGSLAALTEDGKVLTAGIEVDLEDGGTDPSEWENVVGVAAMEDLVVGLLEDGTIVGTDELDDACAYYDNVAGFYGDFNGDVIAITYDGRLLGSKKFCSESIDNLDELNVESFVQDSVALGVDSDGKFVFYNTSEERRQLLGDVSDACDLLYGPTGYMVLYEDGHVELIHTSKGENGDKIANEVSSWTDIEKLRGGSGISGFRGTHRTALAAIDNSGQAHFIDNNANTSPISGYEGPAKDMVIWVDVVIELKPDGSIQTYALQDGIGSYHVADVSDWRNIEKLIPTNETLYGVDTDGNVHCAQLYFGKTPDLNVDYSPIEHTLKNVKNLCVSNGTIVAVGNDGKIMVVDGKNAAMNQIVKAWETETIKDVKLLSSGNIIALTEDGRLLETVITGLIYE